MNCRICSHEIRQRADGDWSHIKIIYGIEDPTTKLMCDAIFFSVPCLIKGCQCNGAVPKNAGYSQQIQKMKQVGENLIEAVKV